MGGEGDWGGGESYLYESLCISWRWWVRVRPVLPKLRIPFRRVLSQRRSLFTQFLIYVLVSTASSARCDVDTSSTAQELCSFWQPFCLPDKVNALPLQEDSICSASLGCKLQALAYDILPLATAIIGYAIGLWKLSANGQFFPGAQTAVIL